MRKLLDTDLVPVLTSDLTVQRRRAVQPDVPVQGDGSVLAIVLDDGRIRTLTCTWVGVRIDETGTTCYDGASSGREIIAFADNHEVAERYLPLVRQQRQTRMPSEQLETAKTRIEQTADTRMHAMVALKTGTGTVKDAKVASSALALRWSNCGNTSAEVLNTLAETYFLTALSKAEDIATPTALAEALDALFRLPAPVVVDISFLNVHTFTLELHHDGGYLVQGYQSSYSAFWWLGLTDEPLMLPGMSVDKNQVPDGWNVHQGPMLDRRRQWGGGVKLSLQEIRGLFGRLISIFEVAENRSWSQKGYAIFLDLPFYVGQAPEPVIGAGKESGTVKTPSPLLVYINASRIGEPRSTTTAQVTGSFCHHAVAGVYGDLVRLSKAVQ